jgi:hypothetical protein
MINDMIIKESMINIKLQILSNKDYLWHYFFLD